MDKKIALVTCYFQHNYGSQLQAYATQLIFDKWNIPNETICIDGFQQEIKKAKYRYFLSKIFDRNVVADKMATVRKGIAKKTKGKKFVEDLTIRDQMFDTFASTMFKLSKKYTSKVELGLTAHDYSAFLVGSDQLWLPSNIYADYYTLNFVPDDVCKIAFSTSFGVSSLPFKQAKMATHFLKRLDYIAVREDKGQKLVKELIDREVPVVCDPTLMFTADEWGMHLKPERLIKEAYLFCYFLGNNPEQRDFVRRVKEQTGYRIVQLQFCDEYIKSDEGFPDYAPYNVGPIEFVQLIRDAEYVFTDSFHCSVFSMLFSKKFFTFRRYNNDSVVSTNSRLYSLLSLAKLSDRLLNANENISECLNSVIDYNSVHQELFNLRKFSEDWLRNCLSEKGII